MRFKARLSGRAPYVIPAGVGDDLLRLVVQVELDPPVAEAFALPRHLELDDLAELILRQRLELHDLVDAVEELRAVDLAHRLRRSGGSTS